MVEFQEQRIVIQQIQTRYTEYDTTFEPQIHQEYQYNGKRYVRVEANSYYDGGDFTLSNGEQI